MKIGLVADTFSVEEGTGIARYCQELLAGLTGKGLDVEPISPAPPSLPLGMAINHALRMPYIVWAKAGHLDLIHATSPITALCFPVISGPKVVTYLDLTSLLGANTSSASHARLFAPLFLRIGMFADRIIVISSQTKEEMIVHLGIPADRLSIVNLGISDAFEPRPRGRTDGCVIGYLGALTRRKGLPYLMRAFHTLRARYPGIAAKLVICGRKELEYVTLVRLAEELGLSRVIEFSGFIRDEELVEAYNSFDVFVLPSEWEGFGMPILEAQKCGVPVITRKDAHIPSEVSKCCLKASSEEDMADKIYELLTNTTLRRAVIDEGLEYSQQFTWERTAQETLGVYEDVMPQTSAGVKHHNKDETSLGEGVRQDHGDSHHSCSVRQGSKA